MLRSGDADTGISRPDGALDIGDDGGYIFNSG